MSAPKAFASPVNWTPWASIVFTWATVPVIVSELPPAPATTAPPKVVLAKVMVPFVTVSVVTTLLLVESTSLIVIPVIVLEPSSSKVTALGTTTSGESLTGFSAILKVCSGSLPPPASETLKVNASVKVSCLTCS